MTELVREGVAAGALGFTTSRTMIHRSKDGKLHPTVTAAESELTAIAMGLKDLGQGVIQMVDDFHATVDDNSVEFGMWRRIVEASGRPLSFNLVQRGEAPDRWRTLLGLVEQANESGLRITGQVCSRPIGLLLGLELSSHPFHRCPTYLSIAHLPLAERVAEMRRPEIRARLLAEEPDDPSPEMHYMTRTVGRMFEFADPPEYSPPGDESLGATAQRLGVTPLELAYDLLLTRDGTTMLYFPVANFARYNLDSTLEMLKSRHTVIGIGDGGAHLGMICDASLPTHVLTYWTRDRPGERLKLGTAIRMLSRDTAAVGGLDDRGLIAPGFTADLNIIDYDRLKLQAPHPIDDLPAGGRRLMQRAEGFVATVKTGSVTYRDGEHTGALPGRLVRGAQAAIH
jgi:N-acyl-D-aspartate/D-glutamate deacylase